MSLLSLNVLVIKEVDHDDAVVIYRSFDGKAKFFHMHPKDLQFVKDYAGPASESSEQRKARMVKEVLAAYNVEEDAPFVVPTSKEPTIVPGYEPEPAPRSESDERAEAELKRLQLTTRKQVELPFKINDEAQNVHPSLSDIETLVFYCYDEKVGQEINRQAFARLSQLPLAKLMEYRSKLPRDLAMHIARVRCAALGASLQGVGNDYIPPSWAAFIEGDSSYNDGMIDAAGVKVIANPPPKENLTTIESSRPFLNRKATLAEIEARFAGMTFRGTESIK